MTVFLLYFLLSLLSFYPSFTRNFFYIIYFIKYISLQTTWIKCRRPAKVITAQARSWNGRLRPLSGQTNGRTTLARNKTNKHLCFDYEHRLNRSNIFRRSFAKVSCIDETSNCSKVDKQDRFTELRNRLAETSIIRTIRLSYRATYIFTRPPF